MNEATDSAIGLYRTGITSVDRLVGTTVGRSHMLDDLLAKLARVETAPSNQHFIFIGPRGIGKTHWLTLVEHGIERSEPLRDRFTVVRFPEESNRILSFADFLLGMVELLGDVTDSDEWRSLYQRFCENDSDTDVIDGILPKLRRYHETSGRRLLIMLENLDTVLTQQIKDEQSIHSLRAYLMDTPGVTFIGTAPVYFPRLYDVNDALYDFFDIQVVEELSVEETIQLIRENLEWEKCDGLLARFADLRPKIQALHEMTGGNPRLTLMLYHLIAHDDILDVKAQFQQLLDRITPFYQDRIKDLPPQERALLETIALMRTDAEPKTPGMIARKLRLSAQQTSTLIRRMLKAGYLVQGSNPADKRSKLYRIKEGFFDLWLAMNESRAQARRLPYLVEFFEKWYADKAERERKRSEIRERLAAAKEKGDEADAVENPLEILDYLTDVGPPDERAQAKLELAAVELDWRDGGQVRETLNEVREYASHHPVHDWMRQSIRLCHEGTQSTDIRERIESMIDYWRQQRSGQFETAARIAGELGNDFSESGLHQLNIELMKDAIAHEPEDARKIPLYFQMVESLITDGQLDAALTSLECVGDLAETIGDRASHANARLETGRILARRGEIDRALELFREQLDVFEGLGDKRSRAVTLGDIARILVSKGRVDEAMKLHEERLVIATEQGDADSIAHATWGMAEIELQRQDYGAALPRLTAAYDTYLRIGRLDAICMVGLSLGQLLCAGGRQEDGVAILERSRDGLAQLGQADMARQVQELVDRVGAGGGEAS